MSNLPIRARALVLASIVVLFAVPLANAASTEAVETSWYRVFGSTEQQVRASLDARRPGKHDARTQWFVDWSYTSKVGGGRCRVATSKVHGRIEFTYPTWRTPADATEELRTKWTTYLTKLRLHEAGHARIGRATATRIASTLGATTAADCDTLDRTLATRVAAHFRTGNAQDAAYDRRTRHGKTQGAVFP